MTPEQLVLASRGGALFAATSSKSSSGSPIFLILLLLIFGVYFLWLRPQRNRLRQQQAMRQSADVGDEVITTGGIIGRIVNFEGDRAEIEVAPGQTLTFHRSAIGRRVDPVVPESADDDVDLADHDHDGLDHEGHDHGDGSATTDEADEGENPGRRWWPGSKGDTPPSAPDGSN